LLKGIGFVGEEEDGIKHEQNFVIFDETILRNLNSGYVMVVDVESFHKIKSNVGKQLYTHLAYRFFVEKQDGNDCWTADYDWLCIHLGITQQKELRRAKEQLKEAQEELKQLGYISDYRWDGWRIVYRPGHVWKGEQLRRASGKSRHSKKKQIHQNTQENPPVSFEVKDPLMPALTAFASGLPELQQSIKKHGLTTEQAEALCIERNIQIHKPQ
jgi:hypothetical protein